MWLIHSLSNAHCGMAPSLVGGGPLDGQPSYLNVIFLPLVDFAKHSPLSRDMKY